jgi:DDE superfamily endonuclease
MELITVLFCCSMDGKKEEPLVIGKSKKPRCFKNIEELPVSYLSSKNPWITKSRVSSWLKSCNQRLQTMQKRIVLLIDNCTAHKVECELLNIKLVFLHPNCTSVIQPLDQGIIKACKSLYRRDMCRLVIKRLDSLVSKCQC